MDFFFVSVLLSVLGSFLVFRFSDSKSYIYELRRSTANGIITTNDMIIIIIMTRSTSILTYVHVGFIAHSFIERKIYWSATECV